MLRDYQKKIIDKLRALKKGARVCVVAPTGSGKSHLISYLAEAFYKQNKKVLIIAHRKTLLEQNREKFKGKASFYCAGLNKKCLKNDVVFGSIQSLANVDLPKFDCVLIDECHRVSFNEDTQYQKLLSKQKEAYIFGFTATPFRLRKGGNVSIVGKGRYFDTLIESDSIASLTKDGYLCPLKTRVDITTSHADFKKDFKLDFDLKEASELLQRKATSYIESIKQAFIKQPPKRAIIFCCDVEHVIDTYNKLNAFIPCTAVASRLTDNKKALADFTSGKAKVLINCEILTEGYDLPSIDYVVLLRPTDSASLYCLDNKTEILTNKGFVDINSYKKEYLIASLNMKSEQIEWGQALGFIRRAMTDDEFFVKIRNQHLDVRVSNKHKVLIKKRGTNKALTSLRLMSAEGLINSPEVRIPTAPMCKNKKLKIPDCELKLLGLLITDGTLHLKTNGISIYQSERHLFAVNYIEKTLKECNLKFTKKLVRKAGDKTNIGVARFNAYRWTVSKGLPRKTDKNKLGWGQLSWFSKNAGKNIPSSLIGNISKEQFEVFAHSMYIGDGRKAQKDGYSICFGNEKLANDFQVLAFLAGWSINIFKQPDRNLWIGTLVDRKNRAITPNAKDRKKTVLVEKKKEEVWCVETKNKTIVTRRNGKIAIIGNCQMVGRGLRTAPSKEHCTVLDFGGNIEKHGPLNDVALDHWSGKTVPPDKVRICPKCFTATEDNPCPECSHSFGFSGFERKKPEDKLKKLHSTMDLLKQQTSTYKIKEIKFFEHFKGGIPSNLLTDRTLRIEFINEHGICMHKEWLALNHAGFAREKATQTWQKFNSAPAPKSVRDALNLTDTIKKIDSITVFTKHNPKDKYPKRTIRAIKYAN